MKEGSICGGGCCICLFFLFGVLDSSPKAIKPGFCNSSIICPSVYILDLPSALRSSAPRIAFVSKAKSTTATMKRMMPPNICQKNPTTNPIFNNAP